MTTGIVGLVPVRGFSTGKTRLAEALSAAERTAIMQWMMEGVIKAALDSDTVDRLGVISPDPSVLAYGLGINERIVPILQSDHVPGLNPAVTSGRAWAVEIGASGMLVLFADLPFLTADDVRTIVGDSAQVVIATDQHGLGTNASLVRFSGRGREFIYQYGPGSARRHVAEAARLGLTASTIQTPGSAFDLDTPQDWRTLSVRFAQGSLARPRSLDLAVPVSEAAVGAGEGR